MDVFSFGSEYNDQNREETSMISYSRKKNVFCEWVKKSGSRGEERTGSELYVSEFTAVLADK